MIEPVTAEQMGLGLALMKARYEFYGHDIGETVTSRAMEIIRRYARHHGIKVSWLLGPTRARRIAHHRQNVMVQLRAETKMSLPEIGRIFNRDHTTVLYSMRAVEARAAQ